MRITSFQHKSIVDVITGVFGNSVRIMLFGSRVDDSARGGDIDLLVITDTPDRNLVTKKIKALARLSLRLGEQKIDMILTDMKNDNRLIVKEALSKGVVL